MDLTDDQSFMLGVVVGSGRVMTTPSSDLDSLVELGLLQCAETLGSKNIYVATIVGRKIVTDALHRRDTLPDGSVGDC